MKTLAVILIVATTLALFAPPTPTPTPKPAQTTPTPAAEKYTGGLIGTWVQVPATIAPICKTYIKINGQKVYPAPGKCWIHTPKKLY